MKRIKMSTPHYNVGSANFILSTSSSFPLISNCYPFSLKSGHKESYSRAYINTVSEFLNIIGNYIKYLLNKIENK